MKKILFLTFLFVISETLLAQNYLISFTASGQSPTIDSIQVSNLTQRISIMLNGSDTLHLMGTVGLFEEAIKEDKLKIYPNPMNQSARIEFENPGSGLTNLLVIDNTGKIVLKHAETLEKGYQIFTISGLRNGHYSIQICNDEVIYSAQIVSTGDKNSKPYLKYEGNYSVNEPGNQMKSLRNLIQMPYSEGDILLLKGFSSNYSRIITIVPTESQQVEVEFVECLDIDYNSYPVVTIGNQTWMAENLKVTHYRNGDEIPNVTENSEWNDLRSCAYCWYDNDINWKDDYGALYNWYAANDSRGLCPAGWHTPTDAEWTILANYLGGEGVAGGKMKSTLTDPDAHPRWNLPNTGATNESGFSGLPGGSRNSPFGGGFYSIGLVSYFWSSSQRDSGIGWLRSLVHDFSYLSVLSYEKPNGYSVRCVRD
ncbi:MAG: T9SS type A sorting domain-containing protein [Lentimicrobium sp.]|nr:T9SS type A sorting domain-containing protein [Lentimicrobium sp.]